jgi:hypothetical protein
MPVLLFLVLGAVQLMLMAHARVMTTYAAYCAARAGIVHNADWNVMRNAALIAALPVYMRTDDIPHFLEAWAKVKAVAEITEAVDTGVTTLERMIEGMWETDKVSLEGISPDLSLIDINVTYPSLNDWKNAESFQTSGASTQESHDANGPKLAYPEAAREIDFDDVQMTKDTTGAGRLAVQVRILYRLRIPFVSRLLFELWLAQELLDVERVTSDLGEWSRFEGRATGGKATGGTLSDEVAAAEVQGLGSGSTYGETPFARVQWAEEVRMLRFIGERSGVYLVPLKASYAMQMQSNPFKDNRRAPAWMNEGPQVSK